MEYKFNFKTEKEKEQLIKDNSNLTLIKVAYLLGESYLVFTDEEVEYELTENEILGNKVSALEKENKDFKEEQEKQNEDIVTTLLANAEVFEIVVGMMPVEISTKEKNTKNVGGNSMVELYVALYIKGYKKKKDIPLIIIDQVAERLEQLEIPFE